MLRRPCILASTVSLILSVLLAVSQSRHFSYADLTGATRLYTIPTLPPIPALPPMPIPSPIPSLPSMPTVHTLAGGGGGDAPLPPATTLPFIYTSLSKHNTIAGTASGQKLREPTLLCNSTLHVPEIASHLWNVSSRERELCRLMFVEYDSDRFPDRNWCWWGLKEFGCHRHMNLGWTWAQATYFTSQRPWWPTRSKAFQPLRSPEVCEIPNHGDTHSWSKEEWAAAQDWFEKNVAVFVLNLPNDQVRWHAISKRLTELNIKVNRVAGVDMRNRDALMHAQMEHLIPHEYNVSAVEAEATKTRGLGNGVLGTVGCAAAHFRAQAKALEEHAQYPLAVVFEDDVSPSDDFIPRLWSLVREELPCDWAAVSLRSMCPFGECTSKHLSRVLPDENELESTCRHGVNYGFQGVLYRSDQLADLHSKLKRAVFSTPPRPNCLDIDVAMASISNEVAYYAVPVVQQPGFLSVIEEASDRLNINMK